MVWRKSKTRQTILSLRAVRQDAEIQSFKFYSLVSTSYLYQKNTYRLNRKIELRAQHQEYKYISLAYSHPNLEGVIHVEIA